MYLKIVLATDDDASKIEPIKEIVKYLERDDIYLMYEAVNEPFIHDKLNPDVFKNILSASRHLYSSGIYTNNKKFWGRYWLDHSARDAEWYRKGGHNLYEAFFGGGPSYIDEPALRIAGIEDEPIRPDQCNYDALNLYAYAASCGLMGAGATFHSESGKLSKLLNANEQNCKDAFIAGLNMFPVETAKSIGNYKRIVEPGNEEGGNNQSGRTYVVENYSIRIHQKGLNHPDGSFKSLDDFGICFGR